MLNQDVQIHARFMCIYGFYIFIKKKKVQSKIMCRPYIYRTFLWKTGVLTSNKTKLKLIINKTKSSVHINY